MKLRVLSDLHFEFHRDGGQAFIAGQADSGWDVLLLAGDIAVGSSMAVVFRWLREAAGARPIVYVPGNHEFYGSSVLETGKRLGSLVAADPLLHVLDNEAVEIDGQRFVGSTLWFEHSGARERADRMLNDFSQIGGFRAWVGGQAARSATFLREAVVEGDVVVTHHLPHPRSVHPQYADSPLNRYFLHDVREVVERAGAHLWVHGHTHSSMDYRVGRGTRVLCNPFGYVRYEENSKFDETLTVEIDPR